MSIAHERFTYADKYGVTIHARRWLPSPDEQATGPIAADPSTIDISNPIGVVQILHGLAEHSDRYTEFAEDLAHAGFIVYADDHRGHGRTGLEQWGDDPAKIAKLGKGGLRGTEDAITQLTAMIRSEHPGLPVAVFGHSWGSLMTQRIINREPELWDAVILSGSAYRTPRHMNSGDLNEGFGDKNGHEWLSRDPEVWRKMAADPRTTNVNVFRMFGVTNAVKLFGTPKQAAANIPILIVSGSADPLNLNDGLTLLATAYRKAGAQHVSLRLYPEARHELINETNRSEVISDLVTWLSDRLSAE
ncbi:alpha/beta fold hydrolase [Canibacter zhoujuaniae]|uniref:alpha/beta fold hydrolase n=1 Tax=Canibacter zhoujuaniae TaxID=2708343 RepID=UPI001423B875|nr:alpha/beta fold hydrolase [Canibacter zhoujuaniae]